MREALRFGRVHELFVTEAAARRHPDLVAGASSVSYIDRRAAELLSETVTPQGIVAVCDTVDVPLASALRGTPRLVAVLAGVSDPGNAGTVLRVADAAGADAVVFAGDTVDVHNGKCVRASTGSLFHLPVARERDLDVVLDSCAAAGLRVVAADGSATHATDDLESTPVLAEPAAWLFGNEAHGLPSAVVARADHVVRVPLYGRAESLNLATAAAVCLYAAAMAARRRIADRG
ncbi:TrmH family RNA methyltransferase [Prauserella shujinwangii]|uniref:TrmH family RNA methyltransferase n=1 Tax=Prauserella shujinwangii TaxID=1453103 RepID=A0A2T0LSX3_9PSEU|nr:TrmH family RNA methyltransferase [Prauserella shujinwangii]